MCDGDVERAIWADVQKHQSGCWTFSGPRRICNVMRLLADLQGRSLPVNMKMYRMPDCGVGKDCVNPDHVGTSEQYIRRIHGWTPIDFNEDDVQFLKRMRILLNC